jgi:hypothetical protein
MNDGGYMTGSAVSNGNFDVIFFYPGGPSGCDETYTLVGSFSDDNTWQATFTAIFSGNCLDCTSQQWIIVGTRV